MHVRISSTGQRFLVFTQYDFRAIGKQAGWLDPLKDYWKGFQSVRDIRSQAPKNQQAHWQAFESVPAIGKGLAQYKNNLASDSQKIQRLIQLGTDFQNRFQGSNQSNDPKQQQLIPQIQQLLDSLSPTGYQLIIKAIQMTPGSMDANRELSVYALPAICKTALNIMQPMISDATKQLDFSAPEGFAHYNQILNTVLGLPEPVQVRIIKALVRRNPALKDKVNPAPVPVQSPTGTQPVPQQAIAA